jgi:hypothetical protein
VHSHNTTIAELIPDFHPLHLAPFGSSRSYPTSPTTRSTSEVPVRTPQSMRNRHGRSNRNPWTVFSGSSGQPLDPELSHRIRHTAPSPRPAVFDIWPLPTIEETARERLESDQYARSNAAFPSAHEEATDRPALVPLEQNRLNSQHSFTEHIYQGQMCQDENNLMYDPPPPYQVWDPNNVANFASSLVPHFARSSSSNFGPSFAYNAAVDPTYDTAPDSPMDTTADVEIQTGYNTGINTLHTSGYSNMIRAPQAASRSNSRVATGRVGKSVSKCVEGIGKTAKDVPKVMKDMRKQHRTRRARAKMSWLERHHYVARDGSLMYAAEM